MTTDSESQAKTETKPNFIVVATEPTPNPAALKFGLNKQAIKSGSRAFNNEEEAEGDPFAEKMFSFGVVDFLYIKERFVSVTLTSAEEWELLLDHVIKCIEEDLVYYPTGDETEKKSSILDEIDIKDFDSFDDATKLEVIDAYMDETIRPALATDGGGVLVQDVSNDVVYIKYQGACGSCSKSQTGTLMAIKNILNKNVSPNLSVMTSSGI